MFAHTLYLRTKFTPQDGSNLVQCGNWTYYIALPGSNDVQTEMSVWSVSRTPIQDIQTLR